MPGTTHHLNLNIRGMTPSATVAINERSNELIAAGREIFKLGLGQSPFPVPEPVVTSLREHAHEKDYLPVKGLPALREAVAAYHRRAQRVAGTADDVLIGPGSKELMFLLQLVYYGEILIPTPAWVSYAPQAAIIGRNVRWIHTRREDDWRLTAPLLDDACRADPSRPRILILNYPSNPTGGSFDRDELAEIAGVARRYDVVVLSDEIYGELHHQGGHSSIGEHYPEGTIISSGLSKWCGAGGWRLGTFMFPETMRWLLAAMAAVASETFTSTSAPIQHAAVSAFRGGDEIERYLTRCRSVLSVLGHWCAETLRAAGARVTDPVGGFYLFPDLLPLREGLGARGVTSSDALCERMLQETGVAILPGSCFGRPPEELNLRLSYVDFDGAAALAAAETEAVNEAFLRRHCPRTVSAMERMADWLTAR